MATDADINSAPNSMGFNIYPFSVTLPTHKRLVKREFRLFLFISGDCHVEPFYIAVKPDFILVRNQYAKFIRVMRLNEVEYEDASPRRHGDDG